MRVSILEAPTYYLYECFKGRYGWNSRVELQLVLNVKVETAHGAYRERESYLELQLQNFFPEKAAKCMHGDFILPSVMTS